MKRLKKTISLEDLFAEVKALRQEVSLFMPTESLEGYTHPSRLLASYKKALISHPTHASHSND